MDGEMAIDRADQRRRRDRGHEVQALLGAMFAITTVVLLAGANGAPVWSHGVRHAQAAPPSASLAPAVKGTSGTPLVASANLSASASASNALGTLPSASSTNALPTSASLMSIGSGTRVLVFGDSFVDAGLSQQMKKLVEARAGKVLSNAWTSSTTTAWAAGDRLAGMLAGFKPDVVFVSIGANEVFLPAPETRAQYIRAIVKRLDKRPCVWIGTPLWKGETGITAVEKANVAPCVYFDSNTVTVDRGPDKIHPSSKGGAAWADAVFAATVATDGKTP